MKAMLFVVVAAALTVPALSLADASPSPAFAACKADYQQLGAAGFAAKYGTGNTGLRACLQAHGAAPEPNGGSDTGVPRVPANAVAEKLCELEYRQTGADAFAAKYGAGDDGRQRCVQAQAAQAQAILSQCNTAGASRDQLEKCLKQALGIPSGDKPDRASDGKNGDPTGAVARAICVADAKTLGTDAFQAKYGKGTAGVATCMAAQLVQAQSIVAACKATGSASRDAFKQCVIAALRNASAG